MAERAVCVNGRPGLSCGSLLQSPACLLRARWLPGRLLRDLGFDDGRWGAARVYADGAAV